MSSPTTPRRPRLGRRNGVTSGSENTPPGSEIPARERITSGAADARTDALRAATGARAEAPATAVEVIEDVETAEMRQQRIRRIATIIAASLIVSAIASGAATVIARRIAQRRAASASGS